MISTSFKQVAQGKDRFGDRLQDPNRDRHPVQEHPLRNGTRKFDLPLSDGEIPAHPAISAFTFEKRQLSAERHPFGRR